MPKQRRYHFKNLQGSSSAGTRSPPTARDGGDTEALSVNERLSELRKAESAEAAAKKREIAESVNRPSVPPLLRGILGVPESTPPRARAGFRARESRRTPGPAPPSSWTQGGVGRVSTPTLAIRDPRRGVKKRQGRPGSERDRPKQLLRFDRLCGLEGAKSEARRLSHYALKTIAKQWELLDEEQDYPALTVLPSRLRSRLLSYLVVDGPAVSIAALRALTRGSEPVRRLDLAGLVGHSTLTLQRLSHLLKISPEREGPLSTAEVAESWDEVEPVEPRLEAASFFSPFSQLTHLCLSHPTSGVRWRDLLALTKHTPHLTHLSLAYWPRPTLTPNLVTTTVTSNHGLNVRAGGTHFYSALDEDLTEPAAILRQLSGNLLRLQWLDLEGCAEWMPALALSSSTPDFEAADVGRPSEDRSDRPAIMTDVWRNVTYLRCFQGWLPSPSGLTALRGQARLAGIDLLREVVSRLSPTGAEPAMAEDVEAEKRRALIWLESESRLQSAGQRIGRLRKQRNCPAISFDFGWTARRT